MDRRPSENRYRGCPGERLAVSRPGQLAQTSVGLAGHTGHVGGRFGGACAAGGDLPLADHTHHAEQGADTDHACDDLERVEITREELIRRIRILRESGVICSDSVSRLHVRLIECCPLRLFAIERALEEKDHTLRECIAKHKELTNEFESAKERIQRESSKEGAICSR